MYERKRITWDTVKAGARVGVVDLETTDLKGNLGRILVAGVAKVTAHAPEEVTLLRIRDFKKDTTAYWDDGELVRKTISLCNTFDYLVTFNGDDADIPHLRSKAIRLAIPGFKQLMRFVDLKEFVKGKLNLTSASLRVLGLHLGCTHGKEDLSAFTWNQAGCGWPEALDAIESHCIADVLTTCESAQKLLKAHAIPWKYDN